MYKKFKEKWKIIVIICVCKCVFVETDKQLVELIHVNALDGLRGHQQSSLRYQSVTLFLRGRSKLHKFTVCSSGPANEWTD